MLVVILLLLKMIYGQQFSVIDQPNVVLYQNNGNGRRVLGVIFPIKSGVLINTVTNENDQSLFGFCAWYTRSFSSPPLNLTAKLPKAPVHGNTAVERKRR